MAGDLDADVAFFEYIAGWKVFLSAITSSIKLIRSSLLLKYSYCRYTKDTPSVVNSLSVRLLFV